MANPKHLAILKQGVKAWNRWREDFLDISPDLVEVNLSHAYLDRANLRRADLSGTKLLGAKLIEANLINANLSGARLDNANLTDANLSGAFLNGAFLNGAVLRGAFLTKAFLNGANLSGAFLNGAVLRGAFLIATDFSNARFGDSTLGDLDLSQVKGLETVVHGAPSTIGIDTIVRSKGAIPKIFLRGAGVPEPFTNMKALIGAMDPIQFYSCFISYSTKDQDFADRLYADLQVKGVRCWFAPHDAQGGRKLHEQIDEAIRLHDKLLLLILSPHSMESEWVKTEISKARKREVRDQARVLFPISLAPFDAIRDWEAFDADTGKDSAREIREYFIPDFSHWKDHDSYRKAFDRLMRDLQAQLAPGAHAAVTAKENDQKNR